MVKQQREARPNQHFFDVFVLFQGRARTDCHEHTSSEIAKEQRLCERAHCSVSQTFNPLQTTCLRHASRWHTSHMWKHAPEHLSHQPPFPSTRIRNVIGAIAISAPRAVNISEFRRTDHGHPLQSMCSRDSVWHSVTEHEDFDAVPTLPPILHTCPRSPWKTTRTECCSNAARWIHASLS